MSVGGGAGCCRGRDCWGLRCGVGRAGNGTAEASTTQSQDGQGEIGLTIQGTDAVITIADDGPGIPVEARASIFERFTRLEQDRACSGSSGGTGLGLAIAREIAMMHHGKIRVLNRLDADLARSSVSTFRCRKRPVTGQGVRVTGSYGGSSSATLAWGARRRISSDPPARSTMLVTSCRPVPGWAWALKPTPWSATSTTTCSP